MHASQAFAHGVVPAQRDALFFARRDVVEFLISVQWSAQELTSCCRLITPLAVRWNRLGAQSRCRHGICLSLRFDNPFAQPV